MKLKKLMYQTGVTTLGVVLPMVTFAEGTNPFQRAGELVGQTGSAAGIASGSSDLPTIIGNIINIVLGFLGIVLLVYLIWGGFLWMTSGGSEEGATKAKETIKNAIIGLIIIVASYALSTFVLSSLVTATT